MERQLQYRYIFNATCINVDDMNTQIHFIFMFSLVNIVLLFIFTTMSCMIFCEPLCCESENRKYCRRRIVPIQ
jgi:hypothetical protein